MGSGDAGLQLRGHNPTPRDKGTGWGTARAKRGTPRIRGEGRGKSTGSGLSVVDHTLLQSATARGRRRALHAVHAVELQAAMPSQARGFAMSRIVNYDS